MEEKVSEKIVQKFLKKNSAFWHTWMHLYGERKNVREVKDKYEICLKNYENAWDGESTVYEKLDAAQNIARAQIVGLARLCAQLEWNEAVSKHLKSIVHHTESCSMDMYN